MWKKIHLMMDHSKSRVKLGKRTKSPRPEGAKGGLFNLRFLEHDVFAHDGIVFAKFHLFSRVARILFGHVKEPGICGA